MLATGTSKQIAEEGGCSVSPGIEWCGIGGGPNGYVDGLAAASVTAIVGHFGTQTVRAVISPSAPGAHIWVLRTGPAALDPSAPVSITVTGPPSAQTSADKIAKQIPAAERNTAAVGNDLTRARAAHNGGH